MQSFSPPKRQRLPNLEQGRRESLPEGKSALEPEAGDQGAIPKDGRVHPQMDVTGVPTAALRCIMPVSPA